MDIESNLIMMDEIWQYVPSHLSECNSCEHRILIWIEDNGVEKTYDLIDLYLEQRHEENDIS